MYLSDINISFNNKSIFDHADFHAVKGRVNIIWGESGSGKSTLIQTLLFRYPCKYVHDGIVISDFSEEERSAFLFEKVSCVYQEPLLIDYLSIRDNIEFTKRIHNINEDAQQILDYLNIADLLDKIQYRRTLSYFTHGTVFQCNLQHENSSSAPPRIPAGKRIQRRKTKKDPSLQSKGRVVNSRFHPACPESSEPLWTLLTEIAPAKPTHQIS